MIAKKIPVEKLNEVKETLLTSVRLMKLVWRIDPWLFTGSVVTKAIPAILPFINIYIYKLILDLVVAATQGTPFDMTQLYYLLAFRIATYFILDVVLATQDYIDRLLWTKTPIELNELVLGKISSLDIHYFESDKFTDLLEKVRQNYHYRLQNQIDFMLYSFQSFIQVTIALGAIAKLNWFLMILVAAVAIPEFFIQTRLSKLGWAIWDSNTPLRKRFWYLSSILQHPYWIKEVRIFQLAKKFLKEIKSIQQKFYLDNKELASKNYSIGIVFNALSAAVYIGVEIFVVFEALAKRVTVGDIGFYTGVVMNFQQGLGGLFRNINRIFENSLYVKSIFELLDAQPIVKESDHPVKLEPKKPLLVEFRKVTFAYPDTKKKILRDFSLVIKPGEKIAFVGENGAGKSTVVKLLARFYDVDKGAVLINGINIKDLDPNYWYRNLGVLFQDFNKYEHKAWENIYFGKVYQRESLKDIIEAAISSGAHPVIEKLDRGYEQILGRTWEEGAELSHGQWQKIALARAFFRNAPILVLDEPTSSIDAKAEAEIFNKVEKLSKDKTVIIISHRFSTVRNADKIYVIDNGIVVESGSHQDLMKLDGQYATLFKLQARGYQ